MCYNEKNRRYDRYLYKFISDHGGWSQWTYEAVKTAVVITIIKQSKLKRPSVKKTKGNTKFQNTITIKIRLDTKNADDFSSANRTLFIAFVVAVFAHAFMNARQQDHIAQFCLTHNTHVVGLGRIYCIYNYYSIIQTFIIVV